MEVAVQVVAVIHAAVAAQAVVMNPLSSVICKEGVTERKKHVPPPPPISTHLPN